MLARRPQEGAEDATLIPIVPETQAAVAAHPLAVAVPVLEIVKGQDTADTAAHRLNQV